VAEVDLGLLEFAVVDLETTGWSPEQAAITEIGAVRVRAGGRRGEFERQGEFASLVNPGMPVPPGIADLTGITDWMLAAAPRLGAVLPGLLDFAKGCVLVAHNAPFDLGFLVAGCGDLGLAWPGFTVLDTVMLARQVMDPDDGARLQAGHAGRVLRRVGRRRTTGRWPTRAPPRTCSAG
jgi:DNA polymerase III, alpha subunit (gram-positive type)